MASISAWIGRAGLAALVVSAAGPAFAASGHWEKTAHGVAVVPASGQSKAVTVEVMSDGIFHVTAAPAAGTEPVKSLMVTAEPGETAVRCCAGWRHGHVEDSESVGEVSLETGAVTFRDADGKAVLSGFDSGASSRRR